MTLMRRRIPVVLPAWLPDATLLDGSPEVPAIPTHMHE